MTERKFLARVVSIALSINLCLIGIFYLALIKSKKQYIESAATTAQNLSQVLEQYISGTVNTIEMGIFDLAREAERQLAAGGVEKKTLGNYMVQAQKHLPELAELRVADADGNIFYPSQSSVFPQKNIMDRDYFLILKNDNNTNFVISKPMKGKIANKWIIVLARRINKPDGTFGGVALGALPLDKIEHLFSSIKVGKHGTFALRDGTDLALVARYPEPEGLGSSVGHKNMSNEFTKLLNKGQTAGWYNAPSPLDKLIRTFGYRKFDNNLYYIFVGLAEDEYLADWHKYVAITGVILGVFFLGSIIAGWTAILRRRQNIALQESLRANDKQTRLFFERQIVGMAISTPDKHWTQLNEKWCQILGYERDELENLTWEELTYPADLPENTDKFNRLLAGHTDNYTITKRFIRKDGSLVIVDLSVGSVRNEDGSLNCALSLMEDVTERKQSEDALRSSEEKFSAIFRTSPDSININRLDDSVFVEVNEGFTNMLGYAKEDVIGKLSTEIGVWVNTEDRALLAGQLKEVGFVKNLEARLRRKDGSIITALVSSRLIELNGTPCTLNITRDITEHNQAIIEKQSLEKQLLHAQKLESLGVLAGGIAHDFNNILTSIIGNADLALMRINPASPAIDNLHKIEQSAARAADLAKQMLSYSGKGKFVVETMNINSLLAEMLQILEVSISKKADLRFNLPQNLPAVDVDATQIRQVVMNLVINASEAIEESSGVIAIKIGCADCDKNYLKDVVLDKTIRAGRYVYLEIADTGCGMDEDTLAKLFDPFFTTKFTGRGLGMAAVQGIIRGHKGFIHVHSTPGKGTSFKVFLPASDKQVQTVNNQVQKDDWMGVGKVLLVDDEETVRGIGKEMLEELGLSVITANDGIDAIETFMTASDFVFVVLDLTMPNMDGEQCFYELKKINPCVKVIISSGFSELEVTQKFAGKGLAGFIQKPYKLSDLKEAIQKI